MGSSGMYLAHVNMTNKYHALFTHITNHITHQQQQIAIRYGIVNCLQTRTIQKVNNY